jgi:hypothetical protein
MLEMKFFFIFAIFVVCKNFDTKNNEKYLNKIIEETRRRNKKNSRRRTKKKKRRRKTKIIK